MGRALLKTGLYERKYFDKVKKVPFESVELYVPHYVKEYLTDRWGDFMRIPPYEETLKYHHSWKWSDVNAFDGYKASGQYVDEPIYSYPNCNFIQTSFVTHNVIIYIIMSFLLPIKSKRNHFTT